jgi:hypothetical protein
MLYLEGNIICVTWWLAKSGVLCLRVDLTEELRLVCNYAGSDLPLGIAYIFGIYITVSGLRNDNRQQ